VGAALIVQFASSVVPLDTSLSMISPTSCEVPSRLSLIELKLPSSVSVTSA